MDPRDRDSAMGRRAFIGGIAGTVVVALGATWVVACDKATDRARAQKLADGRSRLPPGQYVLESMRPMGGDEGDPSPRAFKLEVHGACDAPFELDFAGLLAMPQLDLTCDVHCVTKWSCLDVKWGGVLVSELAKRAKVRKSARFVIFEAANGYTSNVELEEAMKPNVIVAHTLDGGAIPLAHGPPVRAVVPDRYFWKSAKWLTGVRFEEHDEPGFWETRGYHNHADPWKEERTT